MAMTENFTVIDGTLNIEQQQKMLREKFNDTIPREILK
jgi:hypothetical protein